jgi:hypothetical protein
MQTQTEKPSLERNMKVRFVRRSGNVDSIEPVIDEIVTVVSNPTFAHSSRKWYVWVEDKRGKSYSVETTQVDVITNLPSANWRSLPSNELNNEVARRLGWVEDMIGYEVYGEKAGEYPGWITPDGDEHDSPYGWTIDLNTAFRLVEDLPERITFELKAVWGVRDEPQRWFAVFEYYGDNPFLVEEDDLSPAVAIVKAWLAWKTIS